MIAYGWLCHYSIKADQMIGDIPADLVERSLEVVNIDYFLLLDEIFFTKDEDIKRLYGC